MLEFGNKEFRNLQEQVGKNQEDIRRLTSGITISYTVATLGLLLRLVSEENLGKYVIVLTPTPKLYVIAKNEDGEIKAVDLGKYPAVVEGPAGATGASGTDGKDGTNIYGTSSVLPSASSPDYKVGDLYLLQNGDLYKKVQLSPSAFDWELQTSLKGPQGPVGQRGSSDIVANPVDSAVVALNKIKIHNTTYNIPTADDVYSRYQANSRFILRRDVEEPETLDEQRVESIYVNQKLQVNHLEVEEHFIDAEQTSADGMNVESDGDLYITASGGPGVELHLQDTTGTINNIGEIAKKSDLAAIKMNAYQVVDATTYPTLQNFLDNFNGEEGYTYLYPDVGNDDYYRYIWENNEWIYLGSTSLSLEGYANIEESNEFAQKQYFADGIEVTDEVKGDSFKAPTYEGFVDGEGHVVGMSAEEKTRLAKTLVVPTPTITATELVGIDTSKSQARIAIGEGLTLENGTLKATGGGGGGTLTLYHHSFMLSTGRGYLTFEWISENNNTMFQGMQSGDFVNSFAAFVNAGACVKITGYPNNSGPITVVIVSVIASVPPAEFEMPPSIYLTTNDKYGSLESFSIFAPYIETETVKKLF